jgi:trehalose 6-phosphate phosphatase
VRDLKDRVGLPQLTYIGNHGMERWINQSIQLSPEVSGYRAALEDIIDELVLEPGMTLEDKGATLSIHYRQVEVPKAIAERYAAILQNLADNHHLHLSQGKMVFEIRPPLQINKGTAILALVEEFNLDALLFLGDDVTDGDAMKAALHLRDAGRCQTFNLGVESAEMPEVIRTYSDAFLTDPADVTAFLGWLSESAS